MATILDVARRAQVSKTTVSRFLNGQGPINVGTAERIRQAIRALNYSPSFLARGMRTSRTRTIGMIVPDYSNPFYSELLRGIEAYARVRGYLIHLANTDANAFTEFDCINEMVKRQIDGIVLCSYNRIQRDIDLLVELMAKMPVVVMDPLVKNEPISYVVTNGSEGSAEAVSYLVSTGRRRIGYITGPNKLLATHDRFEGYKKGLADCGIPFDGSIVYEADFSMRSGYQAAKWFFSRGLPVDALMAATDLMAVGAIKFFNGQGVDIPGRVAVVGFDNISLCEIIEPSLTTIAQPISDLGRRAAAIIIDAIDEKRIEKRQIVMKSRLIVRKSTDAARSNTLTFDDEPEAVLPAELPLQ
jgi:DNA-binding LacI/PurR family transcriptional regulator